MTINLFISLQQHRNNNCWPICDSAFCEKVDFCQNFSYKWKQKLLERGENAIGDDFNIILLDGIHFMNLRTIVGKVSGIMAVFGAGDNMSLMTTIEDGLPQYAE